MADRIIAGQDMPESRRTSTPSDAADLLEKKSTQLQSLLTCCYGDCCSEWFDAIGMELRDHVMWIAADLAEDVVNLSQDLVKKINAAQMPDG